MAIEFQIDTEGLKAIARANRVIINNPPKGEATVSFRNEKVIYEDVEGVETALATSKLPSTVRRVTDVVAETVTVTDPVTQQEITVSIAGMDAIIEEFFLRWFQEDLDA